MRLKTCFAAAVIVALATSCGSKTGETKTETVASTEVSIVGNWVLDKLDASRDIAGKPELEQTGMQEATASLSAIQKGKVFIDIRKDNKITWTDLGLSGKDKKIDEGTWALSPDKKILTLDFPGNKKEMTIAELTTDKLNLQTEGEPKMNMIFVPKN